MVSNGSLTITTNCPNEVVPGTTVTVGATVTNTGDKSNNTFVILIGAHRADTDESLGSNNSGNLTLAPGQTSAEWTFSFTMPPSNYYVNFVAQRDPGHDY